MQESKVRVVVWQLATRSADPVSCVVKKKRGYFLGFSGVSGCRVDGIEMWANKKNLLENLSPRFAPIRKGHDSGRRSVAGAVEMWVSLNTLRVSWNEPKNSD